ncbi:MAG: type I restriction enzyme HsdR N-terminal domain-containing protein [Deltaproteobacteria bacterium]|nr:type I restriction enzyme HsdR N-terminal domain-containing protein [Deltaproteobacteria bacterium]
MSEHHLILGEIVDFITGKTIKDTHDERYRQKIARFLVEKKGYLKTDIHPRQDLRISIDGNVAVIRIDFAVNVEEKTFMVIRYGPGSLVTRERPSVAAARLLEPYQIPVTIVTNGEDAEILDTVSGKVIAHGFDAIPSKKEGIKRVRKIQLHAIPERQAEKEMRILYAFDIVGSCECGL